MLIYNPAFDLHHGVFRLLQLLTVDPSRKFETERIRILDFFLLFPEEIENIRFPKELTGKRALFRKAPNPYRNLGNARRIYAEIAPFQLAALQSLASRGLLDPEALQNGEVIRTSHELPANLLAAISTRNKLSPELLDLVSSNLAKLPLHGDGGLKSRANLQDTRYDAN
ncbi:MAG: ABC-three component system middle component 5 [Opitutaceae bacterium]|jgi:hypothetical protein